MAEPSRTVDSSESIAWPEDWPALDSGSVPECHQLKGLSMTDPSFALVWEWWRFCFMKVMAPAPEILPPFREVNHQISLIDPNKQYIKWQATCLQSLESLL